MMSKTAAQRRKDLQIFQRQQMENKPPIETAHNIGATNILNMTGTTDSRNFNGGSKSINGRNSELVPTLSQSQNLGSTTKYVQKMSLEEIKLNKNLLREI